MRVIWECCNRCWGGGDGRFSSEDWAVGISWDDGRLGWGQLSFCRVGKCV